jgi:hypothetical protein
VTAEPPTRRPARRQHFSRCRRGSRGGRRAVATGLPPLGRREWRPALENGAVSPLLLRARDGRVRGMRRHLRDPNGGYSAIRGACREACAQERVFARLIRSAFRPRSRSSRSGGADGGRPRKYDVRPRTEPCARWPGARDAARRASAERRHPLTARQIRRAYAEPLGRPRDRCASTVAFARWRSIPQAAGRKAAALARRWRPPRRRSGRTHGGRGNRRADGSWLRENATAVVGRRPVERSRCLDESKIPASRDSRSNSVFST